MRKSAFALALVLLLLPVSAMSAEPESQQLALSKGGASEYVIVVPDSDERNRAGKAATLLQEKLAEATGCKIPIVKEADAAADKPHIYLGKTNAAIAANIPFDELKEWRFVKRATGNDLFLAGNDASANIKDRPTLEYTGTMKAVVSFLEDEAGFRFLLPGPNGVFAPKLDEFKIPATLNIIAEPAIPYCYGRLLPDNVTNISHNHNQVVFHKTYGGHSHDKAVPIAKYYETHPEYFYMINGKRNTDPYNKYYALCISNPEVQELMLQEMECQFDLGYESVQLGQTDGYRPCECENCRALAGSDAGEALWIVHRKLAEEMKKRRPGKKIIILAYAETRYPPKTFDSFPDNVAIEVCNGGFTQKVFDEWEKFNVEKYVYIYNWGSYQTLGFLPKRTPIFVGEQVRLFAANKVRGIYKCGFGENLGLEGPTYYVFGKMLFNPALEPQILADEFYRLAYGKAYAPMKKFFELMYESLEIYSHNPSNNNPNAHWSKNTIIPKKPEDQICLIFTPGLVLQMEKDLALALKLDNDPHVQARLRLVQREFSYLKNISAIFAYYRAYRMSESITLLELLKTELERRNALIDSWYVEDPNFKETPKAETVEERRNAAHNKAYGQTKSKWKMRVDDGWGCFFDNTSKDFLRQGGRLTGVLSAPFTWNFDKLIEAKRRSFGKIERKTSISRLTQSPVIDGKLDDECWQKSPSEPVGEICMGEVREKTSFRIGRDDANLYLSLSCSYAGIKPDFFNPCAKDGPCYGQECIEILLDPAGTRDQYYHFIFNPVADSCYDARFGFISDPVDPNYGREDASWNGDWAYAAHIDQEREIWTAEVKIPFAALGANSPQAGESWLLNVAREHYFADGGVEISLWSPNIEERRIPSPQAFGTAVFE
jgi:hypothetical protein